MCCLKNILIVIVVLFNKTLLIFTILDNNNKLIQLNKLLNILKFKRII